MPTRHSSSAYDDKIRVYVLANVALFAERSDAIKRFVFEALQSTPSDRHRAYIRRAAYGSSTPRDELWSGSMPPALPSKARGCKGGWGLVIRLEQKSCGANRA